MKTYYMTALLGLAFFASSCETARIVTGPDGTPHTSLYCGIIEKCYERAREACNGNYKIINTSNETSGTHGVTSTSHKLLVKCEGSQSSSAASR